MSLQYVHVPKCLTFTKDQLHTAPKPAFSETTAAACRARFFSCLVEITTASSGQKGGLPAFGAG
jgi:hypothetical protein